MVDKQAPLNISSFLTEKEAFSPSADSPLCRTRLFVAANGYAARFYEDPDGSAYMITTFKKKSDGTLEEQKHALLCMSASDDDRSLRLALEEIANRPATPFASVPLAYDDISPVSFRELGIDEPARPLVSAKDFGKEGYQRIVKRSAETCDFF